MESVACSEVSKPRESNKNIKLKTDKQINELDSHLQHCDLGNSTPRDLDSSLRATLYAQNDKLDFPSIAKNTPPQTPPARGGASFNSPSLAEGARGWVESHPFHFCKNSPKDSQTLTFSPKLTRFTEPKAFALKAKDDTLRLNSSSGGAFTLIAESVLNRGGVVFGASFDKNLNVVHRFIESPTELDKLRRSKYVESFIGDSYKQARDFLKAGRIVLFSGVQCQIHALNAFLRKPYSNLITLEVICNSIPSPKIWDIYKESLEQELGEKLTSFNFRTKIFRWENSALIAHTKTKQKIIETNWDSPYIYNAWATHIITRKSCGNCYSKGFVSGADFMLGDFWGIREYHADFVDELGVSCILVHNQKALEILDSLQDSAHIIKTTASIINTSNATLHSGFVNADRESVLRKVISTYERTKDAKKAMAILSQYAQNPNPKPSALRHYYLVWKNDPLRKAISNALKRLKKRVLNHTKKGLKNEKN